MKSEQKLRDQLPKIRRVLKTKIGQVRDRGLLAVAREAAIRLCCVHRAGARQETDYEFDAVYQTDTSGFVQPWDLDIPEALLGQAVQYGTAGIAGFAGLLASLDIEHKRYAFIDLGSGKGRALLLASRFPFKQIIGVELSRQLHQTCCLNIGRFGADWQECKNIVALCQNAAVFNFPAENTVLYLFNPFNAETLRSVVGNLVASLRAAPRRVYVMYVKPVHKKLLEQSGLFSVLRESEGSVIYVNNMPELRN